MRQCKEEARKNTLLLSKELLENREVSWTRVFDIAGHDVLVYKLTLKYLRQQGYPLYQPFVFLVIIVIVIL
jgi:hypothetical protein